MRSVEDVEIDHTSFFNRKEGSSNKNREEKPPAVVPVKVEFVVFK